MSSSRAVDDCFTLTCCCQCTGRAGTNAGPGEIGGACQTQIVWGPFVGAARVRRGHLQNGTRNLQRFTARSGGQAVAAYSFPSVVLVVFAPVEGCAFDLAMRHNCVASLNRHIHSQVDIFAKYFLEMTQRLCDNYKAPGSRDTVRRRLFELRMRDVEDLLFTSPPTENENAQPQQQERFVFAETLSSCVLSMLLLHRKEHRALRVLQTRSPLLVLPLSWSLLSFCVLSQMYSESACSTLLSSSLCEGS